MGGLMISISGSEDSGYDTSIRMGSKSLPVEIQIKYEDEEFDISGLDFKLEINNSEFPIYVEDNVLKINPSNINLATGIYPFAVIMNEKSIVSGYFEWLGNDNEA